MTSKHSSMSYPSTPIDLRELALIIAKAHDLTLEAIANAEDVSENDDEFLTAICAAADMKEICDEPRG